jgi:hypothetical protein
VKNGSRLRGRGTGEICASRLCLAWCLSSLRPGGQCKCRPIRRGTIALGVEVVCLVWGNWFEQLMGMIAAEDDLGAMFLGIGKRANWVFPAGTRRRRDVIRRARVCMALRSLWEMAGNGRPRRSDRCLGSGHTFGRIQGIPRTFSTVSTTSYSARHGRRTRFFCGLVFVIGTGETIRMHLRVSASCVTGDVVFQVINVRRLATVATSSAGSTGL